MEGFNFSHPLQIRWNDMDALGHVNNAVYVSYIEIARGAFINQVCPAWDWNKNIFLIANINVDYHKELIITAKNPKVHVRTAKTGNKSFTLEFAITSEIDHREVVHVTASSVQIMFNPITRETIEMESWIKEALLTFDSVMV